MIALGVPLQYRHDLAHYLLVVRDPSTARPRPTGAYRRQLAEQLLDPVKCQSAAIRLKRPARKRRRAQAVRVAAAVAARRGSAQAPPTCSATASMNWRLARTQPLLRAMALTALASLDESICHTRLAEMMADAERVRHSAFCGLRRPTTDAAEIAGQK